MDSARPVFLAPKARNAGSTFTVAGAVALGAAALTAALFTRARRSRVPWLRGKVVLITGSSRGLGLAMAEEFGRHGARIVLNARDPEELELARTVLLEQNAVASPDDVLLVDADLRKPREAEHLIRRITQRWGQIDVLVNNAGVISVGPIENQTVESFHDAMESNFFSAVHSTMSVLPQMIDRQNGTIVNVASIGGKIAVPHLLPYTSSKFAEVGFSQGLNAELRSKGIHVLTVCPGLMRTGSHLNATFLGNAEREYQWFSLGATFPVISTSARSAARKIVRAVLKQESEIAITPQAVMAARLGNVIPELTALGMGIANRILPDPQAESQFKKKQEAKPGRNVRTFEPTSAKTLGWRAAQRYNELSTR